MRLLRATWKRIATLLHRDQRDREMDAELRAHIEAHADDLMRTGLPRDEALRQAHIALGGIERAKEECRDAIGISFLESLAQDLRFGLRMLRKNPGFTAVAVLTLALGIGANSAVFSMVDAILLRPLPYLQPDRLVRIWESKPDSPRNVVNPVNFLDWRDLSHSFDSMATASGDDANINVQDKPMALPAMTVSADFFTVLRVPPLLGRTFIASDGTKGHSNVVVLSCQLWHDEFGGDPSIVGRQIDVNDSPYIVVGVMPQSFSFPGLKPRLWIPQPLVRDAQSAGGRYLTVVARLKPGVTLAQAQQDIARVADITAQLRPQFNRDWSASVTPLLEDSTIDVRRPLWVLFAAVAFVLLIACANVANLLLMRGTGRLREIAVRTALGASRSRIVRQLLVESLLLSLAGMVAGLLLGFFALRGLLFLLPQSMPLPRGESIGIDPRVLFFTFVAALFTAVVSALLPAVRLSRGQPQQALSTGSQRTGVGGHLRVLRPFVVAEIALALLLSIGAGLMLRSFDRLISVDPGFSPGHLVTMHIWTSPSRYSDEAKRSRYLDQLLDEIRSSPGAESAGSIHFLPLTNTTSGSCFASIDQPAPDVSSPGARFLVISSDYFKTMGTPMIAGREFAGQDTLETPSVAIVNRAFVEKFSPHQNVLDRQYNVCWTVHNPVKVVGVVADARQEALDDNPQPAIFLDNAQAPMYFASIIVRTQGDPRQIMRTAEAAIHRVDPDQAVSDVQTMSSVFSDSVSAPRFQMQLLLVFAGLALALAVVGIYGVVSNSVSQRTQEIGIRAALGATPLQIARLVVGEAITFALIAIVIGVAAALALTRVLETLLFETSPTDFATLLVGSCGVLLIVTLSALLPARRAAKVDPMLALRHE